jgi:hypothetical protein
MGQWHQYLGSEIESWLRNRREQHRDHVCAPELGSQHERRTAILQKLRRPLLKRYVNSSATRITFPTWIFFFNPHLVQRVNIRWRCADAYQHDKRFKLAA